MEHDCVQMLQLICQEDCAFPVRKKALHGFKNLLGKIPATKLAALVSKINFLNYKPSLVESLLSCGDREFQEYLIEILTRLARSIGNWKNVLKSWFHNFPTAVDAVDILESKNFDVKCRTFLNLINESCYMECRIHSLPCLFAAVTGQIELQKPSGYDELWIDCSPRTGDIQLLVDGDDGSWARVTLHFGFIQSIKCRHRKWRLPSGDVESSQLLFEVQPSIVVPFETPVSFTEVIVVLKKDLKFQELENGFLKVIYANYYEPDRASLVVGQRRKATNQSLSTTSFQTGSSGSRKISLANASLSTIEKDPSLLAPGACSSVPNGSLVKQITSSTPLKHKETRCKHRDGRKSNVDAAAVKGSEEVENIEDASTSPGHRSSISDQQISVLGRCAGNDENIQQGELATYLRKSPPNELHISETSAVDLSYLDDMLTDKQLFKFTQANTERAPTANSQTLAGSLPLRIEKQNGRTVNRLVEGFGDAGHGQDLTFSNSNTVSIPGILAGGVRGAELTSLQDLKAPQPTVTATPPPPHPFGMTFFSNFREPGGDMSESQKSHSSRSTEIIKRNFGGVVHIRNPSLDLSKCVSQSMAPKTSENSVNPFSFVEDNDEIGSYERIVEDSKGKFRTPSTRGRKKRTLYTPGKDDVLQCDGRVSPAHFSEWQNKLRKNNRSKKRKNVKCLLDMSSDDGMLKIPSKRKSEKQMAEEIATRKSSRTRKKVTYKEGSSGESGVSFQTPRFSGKPSTVASSRKAEPLRSECVTLSPLTPSGPAPISVDVDFEAVSPPCPVATCEPEPAEFSSPPVEVEMVQLSQKSKRGRRKKTKMKNVGQNRMTCESKPAETSPPLHVEPVLSSPRPKPELARAGNKGKKIAGHEGGVAPSKAALDVEFLAQTASHRGPPLCSTSASLSNQPTPRNTEGDELADRAAPLIDTLTQTIPHKGYSLCLTSASPILHNAGLTSASTMLHNAGDGVASQASLQIEDHTLTIPHDDNRKLHSPLVSPADEPMPHTTDKTVSVDASSMSQVPVGNSNHLGWIDALGHLILSHVKTYVNGVISDNTSVVDSVEVNFNTCLEALKTTMNTIREESMNIARSTANVQSACENSVARFDVVLEMMKVIEDVHRESAIAASIRNNDPRTYSQLRQQIYELINNNVPKKNSL